LDLKSDKLYEKGSQILVHSLWMESLSKIDQFFIIVE